MSSWSQARRDYRLGMGKSTHAWEFTRWGIKLGYVKAVMTWKIQKAFVGYFLLKWVFSFV